MSRWEIPPWKNNAPIHVVASMETGGLIKVYEGNQEALLIHPDEVDAIVNALQAAKIELLEKAKGD